MIIAITGAGISKASGIPTFEERGDLRTKLDRDFATQNPKEFNEIMQMLKEACGKAQPNDAHYALAEYNIPIITMNIDSLHDRAGSQHIISAHGQLMQDNVVLYGDAAPKYEEAFSLMDRLQPQDIVLIIGTSFYTSFSEQLRAAAFAQGAQVEIINDDAEHLVRIFLTEHQDAMEDFDIYMNREIDPCNIYLPYLY